MQNKIYDCVTFFNENYIFDLRYNVLKNYVDKFIICESKYDHKGKLKPINFKNTFKSEKILHIVLKDPFPQNNSPWENQAIQREFILENLEDADKEDYIFFSDPDEIPNPKIYQNFELKKKYGIFMQTFFNYKFNLYNEYESPWEGTRVCKKKDLKSIDFMRQKVKSKNLNYNLIRIDKEKNIQIFKDAGWHFNNILDSKEIAIKLQTFAHSEFSSKKFSSIDLIEKNIKDRTDLFERGHRYQKIKIDDTFPEYLKNNIKKYEKFII